jgi:hypothetical protein
MWEEHRLLCFIRRYGFDLTLHHWNAFSRDSGRRLCPLKLFSQLSFRPHSKSHVANFGLIVSLLRLVHGLKQLRPGRARHDALLAFPANRMGRMKLFRHELCRLRLGHSRRYSETVRLW